MPAPNINQMTADLAAMSDQQLQSYAALHKDDPYTISLAMSESNRRKAMRTPQGAMGMPKVVDVDIANMAREAPRDKNALPENTGIAALPENSMSGMADGGIIGYADEGAVKESGLGGYEQMIRDEAQRQGMDQELAVRLFKKESAGDPNAVSNKGATGLGQLMKGAAKDMGIKPEERTDPEKNVQASVGYYLRQLDTFKDPEKAAAAYNWGPGNLGKHLSASEASSNNASWKVGLPKETADYISKVVPMSSAQAADVPVRPAQAAPAVQMPEGTDAQAAELERRGLILDAAREKMKRLPTMGGFRQKMLDPAMKEKMEGDRQVAQKELDAAEDSYRTFADASSINQPARWGDPLFTKHKPVPLVQAMVAPEAYKAAVSAANTPSSGASAPKAVPMSYGDEGLSPASIGAGRAAPKVEPAVAAKAIAAAKQAIPPEKQAGLGWEDLMNFGLHLMAGKSQYAMQNIGEAGIGALGAKAAREKAASEQNKEKALSEYYRSVAESKADMADTAEGKLRASIATAAEKNFEKDPNLAPLLMKQKLYAFNTKPTPEQIAEQAKVAGQIESIRQFHYKNARTQMGIEEPSTAKFMGFSPA